MAMPRIKPDAAIVTQAVELLNNHVLKFGDYRPGSELQAEPDLFMDSTPPDVVAALRAACVSAAKYLKATFDGIADPPTTPDR